MFPCFLSLIWYSKLSSAQLTLKDWGKPFSHKITKLQLSRTWKKRWVTFSDEWFLNEKKAHCVLLLQHKNQIIQHVYFYHFIVFFSILWKRSTWAAGKIKARLNFHSQVNYKDKRNMKKKNTNLAAKRCCDQWKQRFLENIHVKST